MHSTEHTHTPPPRQTKVNAWILAVSAGLLFWVAAGAFVVALVW